MKAGNKSVVEIFRIPDLEVVSTHYVEVAGMESFMLNLEYSSLISEMNRLTLESKSKSWCRS